jgi:hypothetical protein
MAEREHGTTQNIDYLHPEGKPAPASDSKSVELDEKAKRYLDSPKDQGRAQKQNRRKNDAGKKCSE